MNSRMRWGAVVLIVVLVAAGGIVVALVSGNSPTIGPKPAADRTRPPRTTPTPSPGKPSPKPSPTASVKSSTAPTSPPAMPGATQTPPREDYQQAFAIWPQDTATKAEAACSSSNSGWRDRPATVATRFAKTVLGWKDAQVGDMEGAAGSTYASVTSGSGDVVLKLTGGYPGAPGGYPGNTCYSVTTAQPSSSVGAPPPLHVRINLGDVRMRFRTFGASSSVVTVAHDSYENTRIVRGGTAAFGSQMIPAGTGYALVLYRHSDGSVFTAAGISLPSGNYPKG